MLCSGRDPRVEAGADQLPVCRWWSSCLEGAPESRDRVVDECRRSIRALCQRVEEIVSVPRVELTRSPLECDHGQEMRSP